jgi:predicted RNase H-like HicB family nuclease
MVSNLETRTPVMELTEIERLQTENASLRNTVEWLMEYIEAHGMSREAVEKAMKGTGMTFHRAVVDGESYTVKIEPDLEDGGYIADALTLPGCVTQGESIEEALENAEDAIRMWLKARKEAGA